MRVRLDRQSASASYDDLRKVSPLLGSRNGLDTAEDAMGVVAAEIAELLAVDASLLSGRAVLPTEGPGPTYAAEGPLAACANTEAERS